MADTGDSESVRTGGQKREGKNSARGKKHEKMQERSGGNAVLLLLLLLLLLLPFLFFVRRRDGGQIRGAHFGSVRSSPVQFDQARVRTGKSTRVGSRSGREARWDQERQTGTT